MTPLQRLKEAINDPNLSLRARGLFCHLLFLPYGTKIQKKKLSEGMKEGRDVVIEALDELMFHGYVLPRPAVDLHGKKYSFYHFPGIDIAPELQARGLDFRPGFSGAAPEVQARGLITVENDSPEVQARGLDFRPGFSGAAPELQAPSSSSMYKEYKTTTTTTATEKNSQRLPTPTNPSVADIPNVPRPPQEGEPPPAPPDWWEGASGIFRNNSIQRDAFCSTRRVTPDQLDTLMDRFLADRILNGDYKSASQLWKHFITWFAKGLQLGYILPNGTLKDTISEHEQSSKNWASDVDDWRIARNKLIIAELKATKRDDPGDAEGNRAGRGRFGNDNAQQIRV